MTRVVQLIIFLSFSLKCLGSGDLQKTGARSSAMGHASITLIDVWSVFNNQAALANLKSPTAALYYENRFLIRELGFKAAAVAIPFKSGTTALSFSHFGLPELNESKMGLAYAKSFSQFFSFGAQLDYVMIRQNEDYRDMSFLTFEVGILSQLTEQLIIGVHIYNPINSRISKELDERAPSIIRIGAAYTITNNFLFTAETEKTITQKPVFRSGIEYKIIPSIHLRMGISTSPSTFSFGAGIFYGNLIMDFSTSFHQVLGFSPQAGLSYTF